MQRKYGQAAEAVDNFLTYYTRMPLLLDCEDFECQQKECDSQEKSICQVESSDSQEQWQSQTESRF